MEPAHRRRLSLLSLQLAPSRNAAAASADVAVADADPPGVTLEPLGQAMGMPCTGSA